MKDPFYYADYLKSGVYGKILVDNRIENYDELNIYISSEENIKLYKQGKIKLDHSNMVKVYGKVGYDEKCRKILGYIHKGKWQQDIDTIIDCLIVKSKLEEHLIYKNQKNKEKERLEKEKEILDNY